MLTIFNKKGANYAFSANDIAMGASKSLHTIDEEATRNNVSQTIDAGTMINEIISSEQDALKVSKNNSAFMSALPESFSATNADFQPLLVESDFKIGEKNYASISSTLQNGFEAKMLKLYEKEPQGEKNEFNQDIYKLNEVNLINTDKNEVAFRVNNYFVDLVQKHREQDNSASKALKEFLAVANEPDILKDGKLNTATYMSKLIEATIASEKFITDDFKNNNKELLSTLNTITENGKVKPEYQAMFNINNIINGKAQDITIEKNSIVAYEIGVVSPTSPDAFIIQKNALSLDGANNFEIFKNINVSEDTRKNMDAWADKAKASDSAGLTHAYHLYKTITINLNQFLANKPEVLKGDQKNLALDIIKPLNNYFPNLAFSGKAMYNDIASKESIQPRDIKKIVEDFGVKVATTNYNNNIKNQIKLVENGTRIAHDSHDAPINYTGTLPKGTGFAEFHKDFKIKGTMGDNKKGIVSIITPELTSFYLPSKPIKEDVYSKPRILAPNTNKDTDALLKGVIGLINISNANAKYSYLGSQKEYDANLGNKISSLVAQFEKEKNYKSFQKKGDWLKEVIGFLNANKENTPALKDFINKIKESDGIIKIKTANYSSAPLKAIIDNFKDPIDLTHQKIDKMLSIHFNSEAIEKKLMLNEFFGKADFPAEREFMAKKLNAIVGELKDIDSAYKTLDTKETERVKNEKAQNPESYATNNLFAGAKLRNPGLKANFFNFTNDNGEQEKFFSNVASQRNYFINDREAVSAKANFDNGNYTLIPMPSLVAQSINNNIIQGDFNKESASLIQSFRNARGEEFRSNMQFTKRELNADDIALVMGIQNTQQAQKEDNNINQIIAQVDTPNEVKVPKTITYADSTETLNELKSEAMTEMAATKTIEIPQEQQDLGFDISDDLDFYGMEEVEAAHHADQDNQQDLENEFNQIHQQQQTTTAMKM